MIFSPILDKNSNLPVYMQLYEYIKNDIITGTLSPDSKLPSIREASATLSLSKTTIENAYNQLVAEGYIDNLPKKGYFVCNLSDFNFAGNTEKQKSPDEDNPEKSYTNDGVDSSSFDISMWRRIYNRIIYDPKTEIYTNGSIQGELMLRKEISSFVNTMRGGHSAPEQVIIGAGVQYLLGILIGILKDDYRTVAVENPGYTKAEYIFEDYGMRVVRIPVNDSGFPVTLLKDSSAGLVYISPSHQYPIGNIMPVNKRMELLEWSSKHDGIIIEDDYDGIIRYGGMPIPCLQGLDKSDRVIYLGSFSKMLLPSLRISYMVIPRRLISRYYEVKSRYTQSTSKIDQLVLANFMRDGYMLKHLRKIKRVYRKKNMLLVSSITEKYNNRINIISSDSGLHIMCQAVTNKSQLKIEESAALFGIHLNIVTKKNDGKVLFSLNYSGIDTSEISSFTDALGQILF